MEGILMRGPEKTSIVVRKPDGELEIDIKPTQGGAKGVAAKIPVLRGVLNFGASMSQGVKALYFSAEFYPEDNEQAAKGRFETWLDKKLESKKAQSVVMGFSMVLSICFSVGLFIVLPTLIAGLVDQYLGTVTRNLLEGVLRIAIYLGFLFFTSKQKDIRRTFMYHGAEHKSIFCYEKDLPLTVENVREQVRFHPRCGTSFLFVVMIVGILLFSVFEWTNPLQRVAIRLLMLPLIVGISYEFNRFVGRHDNAFTRFLRAPGLWLQQFTTFEPDDSMIEVAIEALKAVIPENNSDNW